jgi:hypothetical protein
VSVFLHVVEHQACHPATLSVLAKDEPRPHHNDGVLHRIDAPSVWKQNGWAGLGVARRVKTIPVSRRASSRVA